MTPLIIPITFILGLGLEYLGALWSWNWAEPAVDAAIFAVFFYLLYRPPRFGQIQITRAVMIACILFATAGELLLSAYFQFYLYRQSVLPLFVPPGHVLLFFGGLAVTQARWFRFDVALMIVGAVLAVLFYQLWQGRDFLSLGLLFILLPSLYFGKERSLYAVMFILALMLELYGTALGTWMWQPKLLGLGLSLNSANPPLAAGTFYAVLDLLTLRAALYFSQPQRIYAREKK